MAVAVALGGGAPNLTLMTGALWALDRCGVEFKVITTTGAGMVAGLLYAAPRREGNETWREARQRALRHTREMGIDDLIYDQIPVNYKIFQKPGRRAEAFAKVFTPWVWSMPRETRRQRLLGDTLALAAATIQPSSLSPYDQGLCQPPPWIEVMVDFRELLRNLGREGEAPDIEFRLTTYNIDERAMRTFHKEEITADAFKAGLAMPFLYAPYKMKDPKSGKMGTFLEGSAFQTLELNPEGVMTKKDIKSVIIFDLMGHKELIGVPKHLVDAWGKSIVAPLTQIATRQKDFVQLKTAIYKIMKADRSLIRSFDLSTREIQRKLGALREAARSGMSKEELQAKVERCVEAVAERISDDCRERLELLTNPDLGSIEAEDEELNRAFSEFCHEIKKAPPLSVDTAKERADSFMTWISELLEGWKKDRSMPHHEAEAERNWMEYKARMAVEYSHILELGDDSIGDNYPKVHEMPFNEHIPAAQWPKVLDWSYSNMATLWDIGRDTAFCFAQHHWCELGLREPPDISDVGLGRLQYRHARDTTPEHQH